MRIPEITDIRRDLPVVTMVKCRNFLSSDQVHVSGRGVMATSDLRHLDVSLLERLLKYAGLTQFELSDVEGMWNEWYRKFVKALEEAVPLRYVTTMSRLGSVLS